jgi:hypothetical protein
MIKKYGSYNPSDKRQWQPINMMDELDFEKVSSYGDMIDQNEISLDILPNAKFVINDWSRY